MEQPTIKKKVAALSTRKTVAERALRSHLFYATQSRRTVSLRLPRGTAIRQNAGGIAHAGLQVLVAAGAMPKLPNKNTPAACGTHRGAGHSGFHFWGALLL